MNIKLHVSQNCSHSGATYGIGHKVAKTICGSFRVKSTNLKKSSSMTISDFLHFAVYERPIIQEQNKKN